MADGGDTWRWSRWSDPIRGARGIYVIEPASDRDAPPQNARRVPFGFSRALVPDPVEREPVLWEGSD